MMPTSIAGGATSPALSIRERHFFFGCVDGTAELETTYRVRYQVYCVERGFLRLEDYPDGLEWDVYDAHSVHILATHCAGEPAGTARLVMSSPPGFPLVEHCRFADGYDHLNDPSYPGFSGYAEISRLAISKSFRRRAGDTPYGGPPRREPEPLPRGDVVALTQPRGSPEILMGICRQLYQESKRRGVTDWLLAMERSLYVMLKRLGFHFFPAGPEVDYYGPVRPYVTSIEEFERGLYTSSPAMLQYLVQGLPPELIPNCAGETKDCSDKRVSVA